MLPKKISNPLQGTTAEETATNVRKSLSAISTIYRTYPYLLRSVIDEMVMGRPIKHVLGASYQKIEMMIKPVNLIHITLFPLRSRKGSLLHVSDILFFRKQFEKSADYYFEKFSFLKN